ncbi:DNA polymerase III subunit beta [Patescibacteria group bacterium]|nr:DNA polymerase III subunit beta [Patescibacteria group bacterium]MBU1966781.1 DNA polymerase III subunit beta [Patescibacteria group bacterium]MBU2543348.1 DNA polymerase III subunit beta [Patescibacteria group bacterium]
MKLELLQENLTAALNQLHRIIPNKPQLSILSSILLEAKNNSISLSATDLYVGIKTKVAGKVIKPASIAIPGRIFHNSIATLDPGKLELSLKGDTLTITSANNTITIACLAADEFPEFPQLDGKAISLEADSLERIQNMVGFSASVDPTRPVLTALLLQFDQEGLLVVGTDGFRLATLKLSALKNKEGEQTQILIPAKAMNEAARIAVVQDTVKIGLRIAEELKQAEIEIDNTRLYVRLIDGEYPPFNKIIPAQFTTEIELDGKEFESQLKRAQVFARESSNIIRLQIRDGEMRIISASPAFGRQEGVMGVEVIRGKDGEIAFNSRYLLDFISAHKPEKISFYMNESLSPAMFRPTQQQDYKYIVMPFRVNE